MQLLRSIPPMIIHAIVYIPFVLNASVDVPSAAPVADQHSSQLAANVATREQLVEVFVKAFQLAGSPDGYPSHFAIGRLDLIVHQVGGKGSAEAKSFN